MRVLIVSVFVGCALAGPAIAQTGDADVMAPIQKISDINAHSFAFPDGGALSTSGLRNTCFFSI